MSKAHELISEHVRCSYMCVTVECICRAALLASLTRWKSRKKLPGEQIAFLTGDIFYSCKKDGDGKVFLKRGYIEGFDLKNKKAAGPLQMTTMYPHKFLPIFR